MAQRVDGLFLDLQWSILGASGARIRAPEITIVGIDDESLQRYREPLGVWHEHLGDFLKAVALSYPKVVALDVIVPERSYDFVRPGLDAALLSGVHAVANSPAKLYVGSTVLASGKRRPVFPPILALTADRETGLVLMTTDYDGTIRRTPSFTDGDKDIPTLSSLIAGSLGREAEQGLINFHLGRRFDYVPFHDIVDAYRSSALDTLKGRFTGNIVLLGFVSRFNDRHLVSVPLAAWEPDSSYVPGVLIHAQILRTYLEDLAIPVASKLGEAVLILILLASQQIRGTRLRIAFGGIATLAGAAYSFGALQIGYTYVNLSAWLTPVVVGLISKEILEAARQIRERSLLQASFGRYVSPQILGRILSGNIRPDMRPERKEVCVLFSDIRNFTRASETKAPEEVIEFLNRYFDRMVQIVHEHDGTVDKFIGDGLMAFFGAPNELKHPCEAAVKTAMDMVASLRRINSDRADEGLDPIDIGIGLHWGDVVVGHVGSSMRHEYTIIGDAVNVASRIESLTKGLGYRILCTRDVYDRLLDNRDLHSVGLQPLKGHAHVEVFAGDPIADQHPV